MMNLTTITTTFVLKQNYIRNLGRIFTPAYISQLTRLQTNFLADEQSLGFCKV